jgi:hypothetical protein
LFRQQWLPLQQGQKLLEKGICRQAKRKSRKGNAGPFPPEQ